MALTSFGFPTVVCGTPDGADGPRLLSENVEKLAGTRSVEQRVMHNHRQHDMCIIRRRLWARTVESLRTAKPSAEERKSARLEIGATTASVREHNRSRETVGSGGDGSESGTAFGGDKYEGSGRRRHQDCRAPCCGTDRRHAGGMVAKRRHDSREWQDPDR